MSDDEAKGFKVSDRRFWAEGEAGTNGDGAARAEYPTFVEQLRADLAEKDKQLREYIAAYKEQVVKGVDDTKARLQRENEREIEQLRGKLVEDLLDVLDNLDRSLQAGEQSQNPGALLEGVRLVRDQFATKLAGLGLAKQEVLGQRFDPALHEAVGLVPVSDPSQDGVVVNEVKAGYKFGDRVLRPTLVQVGKLAG